MKLTTAQRGVLFAMFHGHCAYCGEMLPEKGWHADHVEAIERKGHYVRVDEPHRTHKFVQDGTCRKPENQRVDNFMPSCRACNIDKTCYSLEDWRQVIERRVEVLRKNYSAYRHAERFGLVAQIETKVIFYFERLAAKTEGAAL